MLVWDLIVGCWVGLLLLLLHDTTKEDSEGSAVFAALRFAVPVASKSLKNLFNQARSWANKAAPAAQKMILGKHANTIPAFLPTSSAQACSDIDQYSADGCVNRQFSRP